MKILIFSTAYFPFVGGAELAIKEITDRLPAVSFTLITTRFKRVLPSHERLGNVEVYRVGHGCWCDKWLLPFRALRLAKKLEQRERFDVIWSVMASQGSIAAAWFKKAFPDKKLVLTLQEGDEEEHLKRYVLGSELLYRLLIRPWYLLVFKQADAITAISNYLAERARKNNPRVQVIVVPNGVDITKFQITNSKSQTNSSFQKEEMKKILGFKGEDKIIITTSRLVGKNGIGDLIEAMQYLPERVTLLILGTGFLESDLKLKTSNLKLTNRIRFVGYIPHAQIPPYLWASDIFCRPSRSEGMGSSFVEAMAAGLPVIATPVGGIPDFLFSVHEDALPSAGGENCGERKINPAPAQGERVSRIGTSLAGEARARMTFGVGAALKQEHITGLFCRVGDPKDIAEKIQLLLSSDELRSRIIANASKMVREKYDWNRIAEKMNVVLKE